MGHPKQWSIEYQVREDAESMFIPAELLPDAEAGDVVEITSAQPCRESAAVELPVRPG